MPRQASVAAAVKPAKPAPTDLDEEATSTPADLPEDPTPADLSVLLVKGVPQ